jgi:IclR helix-turn-helix domain
LFVCDKGFREQVEALRARQKAPVNMLRIVERAEGTARRTAVAGAAGDAVRRAPPGSTARQALKILELFSPDGPVLGVSEVGRRLGVHKSNVSRLVAALHAEGFLARTENGRYLLWAPPLCDGHDRHP